MAPQVEDFLLLSCVILCQLVTNSRSDRESCYCLSPFPGPDILYNIYKCSVALDWSEFITSDCQSATGYEVQYVSECAGDVISIDQTTNTSETFQLPTKILRNCSMMKSNCYVRMRFKFNDSEPGSWSRYSAWTALSNDYEATETCIINGTDSCFKLVGNCSNGSPEFIINQKHYLFQDIYFNTSLPDFDVTYNPIQTSICFRNIRANISFTEFCLLHSDCTSSQFPRSDDEEVVIVTKINIDVKSGVVNDCSTCYTPASRSMSVVEFGASFIDVLSLYYYAKQDQCVVVDFTESGETLQSWISNVTMSLQNVCFTPVHVSSVSTESKQGTSSQSAIMTLRLNAENQHTGGYLRSVARYQQNSSYCFVGYFDVPPRTVSNNENITIILVPCASEDNPTTSSSTPLDTPEPPNDGNTTTIIICIVVPVASLVIILMIGAIVIYWYKRKSRRGELHVHVRNLNLPITNHVQPVHRQLNQICN